MKRAPDLPTVIAGDFNMTRARSSELRAHAAAPRQAERAGDVSVVRAAAAARSNFCAAWRGDRRRRGPSQPQGARRVGSSAACCDRRDSGRLTAIRSRHDTHPSVITRRPGSTLRHPGESRDPLSVIPAKAGIHFPSSRRKPGSTLILAFHAGRVEQRQNGSRPSPGRRSATRGAFRARAQPTRQTHRRAC